MEKQYPRPSCIEKQDFYRPTYIEKQNFRTYLIENQVYRTPNNEKQDYRTSLARKIVNSVKPSAKRRYRVVEVVKRMFGPSPQPGCLSVAGAERFRWRKEVTFNQANYMESEVHSYIDNQVHSFIAEEEPLEGDENGDNIKDEVVAEGSDLDSHLGKSMGEEKSSLKANMMKLMSHLGSQERLADITYESFDPVDTNMEFKLNKYTGKSCLL